MKQLVTLFLFLISVHLAWDASVSTEVTGYKVHYGTASGVYTTILNVGNVLHYVVPNVDETQPIYFAVTAYSPTQESAYSTELAGAVISSRIAGGGAVTTRQSDWASGRSDPIIVVEKNTGKHAILTITPSTNYSLSALKVDGSWITPVTELTFSIVSANHSLEAIFHKKKTLQGMEWIK